MIPVSQRSAPESTRPAAVPCPTETPVLTVDTSVVAQRYDELAAALPGVRLHYAVKANPATPVLRTLAGAGARWDVASAGEIDAVLACGADPADMSFGSTIKRPGDIAYARALGVERFTLDAPAELDKLGLHAPGSTVMVRITTSGDGADWALGEKFGCPPAQAAQLLERAVAAGHRVGVAFHVGSQQHDPQAWDAPLAVTAQLREAVRARGADLAVVNLGGGFPVSMAAPTAPIAPIARYGTAICAALRRHLGPDVPEVMAEPGRFLVADAGTLDSEVLLVAERDGVRWVYLDVGLFTGMIEALGEQIRYRLEVLRDGVPLAGPTGEVVLAGPTCDSLDVLYRERRYRLPLGLRAGDRVRFAGAGAYTSVYSTRGFNGFAPLREAWV